MEVTARRQGSSAGVSFVSAEVGFPAWLRSRRVG
jgi:hypothetical protein